MSPERVRSEIGPACSEKNLYSFDRALKMGISVLFDNWDEFFATQPTISSGTRVIYSSRIPREFGLRAWIFLGWSSWLSLLTVANIFCSSELPYLNREKWSAVFQDWIKYYCSLTIVGELQESSFCKKKQLPLNSTSTIIVLPSYCHLS